PPEFFPEWPGPRVDKLYEGPFETARFLPDRPNREGVVVYAGDTMLKIKQQEYVELHKATKRMSAKVVWEEMGRGRTPEDIARGLPRHVQQWVKAVADELRQN